MCIHIKQGKMYLIWFDDSIDIVSQTSTVLYKMLNRITFKTVNYLNINIISQTSTVTCKMFSRITFKTVFLPPLFMQEIHSISSSIRFFSLAYLWWLKFIVSTFFLTGTFLCSSDDTSENAFLMSLSLFYTWNLHMWSLLIFLFPQTSSLHLTQKCLHPIGECLTKPL